MIGKTLQIGNFQYYTELYTEKDFGILESTYSNFVILRNYNIVNNIVNDTHIYIMDKSIWLILAHELENNKDIYQDGLDHVVSTVFPIQSTTLTGFSSLYNEFNSNFDRESFYKIDKDGNYIYGNDVYPILDKNGNEQLVKCCKLRIYHPSTKNELNAILTIENNINGIHWYYLCNTLNKYPNYTETEIRKNNNIYSEYIEVPFPDIDWLFKSNNLSGDKMSFNAYFDERLNTVISTKNENFIQSIIVDEVERYYQFKFNLSVNPKSYENIVGEWLFYLGQDNPIINDNIIDETKVERFYDSNSLFDYIAGNVFPIANEDIGVKYVLIPKQFDENIVINNVLKMTNYDEEDTSLPVFEIACDIVNTYTYNNTEYILYKSKPQCKKIKLHDVRKNIKDNKYFYIGPGNLDEENNYIIPITEIQNEDGTISYSFNCEPSNMFYDINNLFSNHIDTTRYIYKYEDYSDLTQDFDTLYILFPTMFNDQFIFSDSDYMNSSDIIFEINREIIYDGIYIDDTKIEYTLIRLDYVKNKKLRIYTIKYRNNMGLYSLSNIELIDNYEHNINNYIDLQYQLVPLALMNQPYTINEDIDPLLNDITNVKVYLKNNKTIENNYLLTPFNISIYPISMIDSSTGQYIYDDNLSLANNTYAIDCSFELHASFGFNEENHRASIVTVFDYPNKELFLINNDNVSSKALQEAYKYYNNIDINEYKYFWVNMLLRDDPSNEELYVIAYDDLYENRKFDTKGCYVMINDKKCYNIVKKIGDEYETPDDLTNYEKIKRLIDVNYDNLWDQLRDWEIEEEYQTNMDFFGFRIQISTDVGYNNIIYSQTYSIDIDELDDFVFELNKIFDSWYEFPETLICSVAFIDHIFNKVISSNTVVITKEFFKYLVNDNNLYSINKINTYNDMLKEINLSDISIKQNDIVSLTNNYYNSIENIINKIIESIENDNTEKDILVQTLKKLNEDFKNTQIDKYLDNYSPFNFINDIKCVISRTTDESVQLDTNPNTYTPKILYQPIFFRTQDAQNIRIRDGVVQNIGINLVKYMTKVETFSISINNLTFIEVGRNDGFVIFSINGGAISGTSGTYNILTQDNDYITSGNWQKY